MTTVQATSISKAREYRGLTFQASIHIDIWALVDRFIGSLLTLNAALQRVKGRPLRRRGSQIKASRPD